MIVLQLELWVCFCFFLLAPHLFKMEWKKIFKQDFTEFVNKSLWASAGQSCCNNVKEGECIHERGFHCLPGMHYQISLSASREHLLKPLEKIIPNKWSLLPLISFANKPLKWALHRIPMCPLLCPPLKYWCSFSIAGFRIVTVSIVSKYST